MKTLEGKVAVITGGSSGIGFATAKLFKEVGARVAISGRNQQSLDAAVKELGAGVVFEDELSNSQARDLIHRVTKAVIPFVGEKLRDNTWVLIEEIASGSWGIGGKAFGLKDVRAIQSQE